MNSKILLGFALVAVVVADKRPSYLYGAPQQNIQLHYPSDHRHTPYSPDMIESMEENSMEEHSMEESDPPKYEFHYGVRDGYLGVDFTHAESRDENETQGSYTVQLPDGRLQKVIYYVDGDSGYVADVTYEGEAQYPESKESRESPVYTPPRSSHRYPESEETQEPVYSPPRRSYGFPQ